MNLKDLDKGQLTLHINVENILSNAKKAKSMITGAVGTSVYAKLLSIFDVQKSTAERKRERRHSLSHSLTSVLSW